MTAQQNYWIEIYSKMVLSRMGYDIEKDIHEQFMERWKSEMEKPRPFKKKKRQYIKRNKK